MDSMIYERPREKLRNQGAQSLSLSELLQLVVGPGSSQVSGAQLASVIESSIKRGHASYDELIKIPGMGQAKVCQVLAALELAGRLTL